MLKLWLCFLSFFYTVNSFSTEEEKAACWMCEEDDSSLLLKPREVFSCNCVDTTEDKHICKKCILKCIVETINSKKEKEFTENNKKIEILQIIFGCIGDAIIDKENKDIQDFVKNIIEEGKTKNYEDIKIEEYQELNTEKKLVYKAINEKKDDCGNTIFYIGNEQDPTKKLKFIKSFLSLLKKFNPESHSLFTRNIEWSIWRNCQQEMKIKEIEEWEKDVEINLSVNLDTTELQEKIKNEKVISIICPFCLNEIEGESAFFLKKIFGEPSSQESSKKLICEEPSSQESSKKFSCLKYCGNICSDCF